MSFESIDFKCKEHVIWYFLKASDPLRKINLSHYDFQFMSNMQSLTHEKKEITSNQAALFDKLISKYRKQLASHGIINLEELKELPWQSTVVPSLPKYTNANVDFDSKENLLTIRVPFKKDFINKFRTTLANPWQWNGEKKRYECPPSSIALRVAYTRLPTFFTTVYHNEINTIITQLEKEKATKKHWNPTLVLSNGKYEVTSSNEILDNLLSDTTLDNSPKCLYKMSTLGINVDEKIIGDDAKLKFASSQTVEVDVDDDLTTVLEWITELECNTIYCGGLSFSTNTYNSPIKYANDVITALQEKNFNTVFVRNKIEASEVPTSDKSLPMYLQIHSSDIDHDQFHSNLAMGKILIIKNKRPLEVK